MMNQITKIKPATQSCKRCQNIYINIVRDMKLWWVECDRCKTTYMCKDQ